MLHTLNKAWIKCFLNQAKKNSNLSFLFVAKSEEEQKVIAKIISNLFQKKDFIKDLFITSFGYYYITTEKEVIRDMTHFSEYFPMWDDILISHDIHDPMIINFLLFLQMN